MSDRKQKLHEQLVEFFLQEKVCTVYRGQKPARGTSIEALRVDYMNHVGLHAEITDKVARVMRILDDYEEKVQDEEIIKEAVYKATHPEHETRHPYVNGYRAGWNDAIGDLMLILPEEFTEELRSRMR